MKFVGLLLLIAASPALNAANKKSVTFIEPVTVAGIMLDAGEYLIEWNGRGCEVQVTFWHGNKKVVTLPAAFRAIRHAYDAVTVLPETSGPNTLLEIDSQDSELRFDTRGDICPIT